MFRRRDVIKPSRFEGKGPRILMIGAAFLAALLPNILKTENQYALSDIFQDLRYHFMEKVEIDDND